MAQKYQEGDYGIKVVLTHNAAEASQVYYQIDGNDPRQVVNNEYFILTSDDMTLGDHTIEFYEETADLHVTARKKLKYTVVKDEEF